MSSLYFFISYKSEKKENASDIVFTVPEKKEQIPESIFVEESYENQIYYYKKIFKVDKYAGKGIKGTNYYFEFEVHNEKNIISFDSKESIFVYDVTLEIEKKLLDLKGIINQNIIGYNH